MADEILWVIILKFERNYLIFADLRVALGRLFLISNA